MTANQHFSISISEFLEIKDKKDFTGKLKSASLQTDAWDNQFIHLQTVLKNREGRLIFEYGIPGLPKVIDVVLLTEGKIFVLEYKNGSEEYTLADQSQANGYALRLKYFHSTSRERIIIPILIATEAKQSIPKYSQDDQVYETSLCNYADLGSMIDGFCLRHPKNDNDRTWEDEWEKGIYQASPTIIEAAKNVWNNQNVEGLQEDNGFASAEMRLDAEDFILNIIKGAKERGRKAIVFVTGVPGAGKTLVGLNLSVRAQEYGASMLSGNDPLVEVLTEALRRNLDKQYKENKLKQEVKLQYENAQASKKQSDKENLKNKISVEAILRSVYSYKNEIINSRLNYEDKTYTLKGNCLRSTQHVIIYDESQRAWTRDKMLVPGQAGKKPWQDKDSWPFSEPGILLWDMNQLDWGVFVCLVGGGQEIHKGEAGISEWLYTLSNYSNYSDFREWDVYMASDLEGSEYNQIDSHGGTVSSYVDLLGTQVIKDQRLFLKDSKRTTRSENVSTFINKIIDGKATASDYKFIKKNFPIYLTRDIKSAKAKLRERKNEIENREKYIDKDNQLVQSTEVRMGLLMSSGAVRLRPLGFDMKKVNADKGLASKWFLDSMDDCIDSSDFLEVALNEFFVQGLEINFSAVIWDADFRYDNETKRWRYFRFGTRSWTEIEDEDAGKARTEKRRNKILEDNQKKETSRFYRRNAYRVLLTRARDGMVICVPKGDPDDDTRSASFYDSTYDYLSSLGFELL